MSDSGNKPVILIVDDSRVMRIALKKILTEDYTVMEAVNGEDAWEKVQANAEIRCVFTDLSMPELDGFGLLALIRKASDERVRQLPVIIITGNQDDQSMRDRALNNGANDIVLKPFQSGDIKATTAKQLKKPEPKAAPAPKPAADVRPAEQPTLEVPAPKPSAPESTVTVADFSNDSALLQASKKRLAELESKVQALQGELKAREQKQQGLEEKARQAEQALERERQDLARREEERQRAEEEARRQLEDDVVQFQGQIDSALARVEKAEEQLERERGRVRGLEHERRTLEDELARVRSEMMLRQRSGDQLRVEEQLVGLRSELDSVRKRLVEAESERDRLAGDLQSRQVELDSQRKEIESAEQTVSSLRSELNASRGAAQAHGQDKAEIERLRSELDLARRQAETAEQTQRELREQIQKYQREADTHAQQGQAEVQRLRQDLDSARSQYESAEKAQRELRDELESYRRQAEVHGQERTEIERLRRELDEARQRSAEFDSSERALREENQRLVDELTGLRGSYSDLERDSEIARQKDGQQVVELQKELRATKSRLDAADRAKAQADRRVEQIEQEMVALRESRASRSETDAEIVKLRADADSFRVQMEAAELAQKEAEDDVARMAVEVERLEDALKEAEYKVMRQAQELGKLRKKVDQPRPAEPAPRSAPKRMEPRDEPATQTIKQPAQTKSKKADDSDEPEFKVNLSASEEGHDAARLQDIRRRAAESQKAKSRRAALASTGRKLTTAVLVVGIGLGVAWFMDWPPFGTDTPAEVTAPRPSTEAPKPAPPPKAADKPKPAAPPPKSEAPKPAPPPSPVEPSPVVSPEPSSPPPAPVPQPDSAAPGAAVETVPLDSGPASPEPGIPSSMETAPVDAGSPTAPAPSPEPVEPEVTPLDEAPASSTPVVPEEEQVVSPLEEATQ